MADEEKPEEPKNEVKGTDYTQPSKKKDRENLPEKKITQVVTTEVTVKKEGLGSKIKGLFVAADFKSVLHYVGMEVLVPAARNMIADTVTKGVDRMVYGETRSRRMGPTTRYSYQSPVNRDRPWDRDPRTSPPDRTRFPRRDRRDFIIPSRSEAEEVIDQMYEVLGNFDAVSVADLNEMVGVPSSHTDNKWGWTNLTGADIIQVREGWLLDLPREEPL